MTCDPHLVARLLDLVARQLHSDNPNKDLVAGQWAILRYLENAGSSARTAPHVSGYLGSSLPETRLAMLSLHRKRLVESHAAAGCEPEYQLTALARSLSGADPIHRAAVAIGALPEEDRVELARLLEALAGHLAS